MTYRINENTDKSRSLTLYDRFSKETIDLAKSKFFTYKKRCTSCKILRKYEYCCHYNHLLNQEPWWYPCEYCKCTSCKNGFIYESERVYTEQELFEKCCEVEISIVKFGYDYTLIKEKNRLKALPTFPIGYKKDKTKYDDDFLLPSLILITCIVGLIIAAWLN